MIPGDDKNSCFICGNMEWLERHHVFGGPDRAVSERYDITCHLCKRHHTEVHGKDGKPLMDYLHEIGQEYYEQLKINTGMSPEEARDTFRKEFRKSYL